MLAACVGRWTSLLSTCASWRSMASGFHRPHSLRSVDNVAREAVAGGFVFAVAETAEGGIQRVFGNRAQDGSDAGRRGGLCRSAREVSCRMASACVDNGIRCGRRILVWLGGMVQTAFSKGLVGSHSASRSSPGRGKRSATSCSAALVVGWPSKPSMARSRPPKAFSSVMAARCVTFGVVSAPRRAKVGSFSARAVAMA